MKPRTNRPEHRLHNELAVYCMGGEDEPHYLVQRGSDVTRNGRLFHPWSIFLIWGESGRTHRKDDPHYPLRQWNGEEWIGDIFLSPECDATFAIQRANEFLVRNGWKPMPAAIIDENQ